MLNTDAKFKKYQTPNLKNKILGCFSTCLLLATSSLTFPSIASPLIDKKHENPNKIVNPYLHFDFDSFIESQRQTKLEYNQKEGRFVLPKSLLEVANKSNYGKDINVYFDPYTNSVEVSNIAERSNPVTSIVIYILEHTMQSSDAESRQEMLKKKKSSTPIKIGNINIIITPTDPALKLENFPKNFKSIVLLAENTFGDFYIHGNQKKYKPICNGVEISDKQGNIVIATASHCAEDFVEGTQIAVVDGLGLNKDLKLMKDDIVILAKINDLIIFGKRNKHSIDLAQSYVNELHKTYLKYFEILTKGNPESIKIAVKTFRGNTGDKFFTTETVVPLKNNPNPNLNLKIDPDENTSITIGNLSLRNEIFTNHFIPNLAIYPNTINVLTNGASGNLSTSHFLQQ